MPFWSVCVSLNCCRLFKIYTSYIISKCRLVKMINIPCFLVPHFSFLSVQSYKRPKLGAFKEYLFRKTNGRKIRVFKINAFANALNEQNRNNYSIPCKIRPVQEKMEIVLILTFLILIFSTVIILI